MSIWFMMKVSLLFFSFFSFYGKGLVSSSEGDENDELTVWKKSHADESLLSCKTAKEKERRKVMKERSGH